VGAVAEDVVSRPRDKLTEIALLASLKRHDWKIKKVAEDFDVSAPTIRTRMRELSIGAPSKPRIVISKTQIESAIKSKGTVDGAAKLLGVSSDTISSRMREFGIPKPKRVYKPLTQEAIEERRRSTEERKRQRGLLPKPRPRKTTPWYSRMSPGDPRREWHRNNNPGDESYRALQRTAFSGDAGAAARAERMLTRITGMRYFEFRVMDAGYNTPDDNLWGDIRFWALTEGDAAEACRQFLLESDVEPEGSLIPPFVLTSRESGVAYTGVETERNRGPRPTPRRRVVRSTSNPMLRKRGKRVSMGGHGIRDVPEDVLEENILTVRFGRAGAFMGYHPETRITYFFINPASRDLFERITTTDTRETIPLFSQWAPMGSPGTIGMFWRHKLSRKLAGAVQWFPDEEVDGERWWPPEPAIVVTHMTTKPQWRRTGVNSRMMRHLSDSFPGRPILFHDLTPDGRAFMEGSGVGGEFVYPEE